MSTGRWIITAACLLVGQRTSAHGLAGELFGTVTDEQGAVLNGARVRV